MPRILLVDDEPHILSALKRVLRRSGFEVETAGGGDEALSKLDAFAPELVMSDFKMPGMNGAELLALVRQRQPLALRVMLSGCADLDSVIASVNDGEICRFISKPWDDRVLVSKLQSLLKEREIIAALHQQSLALTEDGAAAQLVHSESTVELRLQRKAPFSVEKAAEIIRRFAGALAEENLAIVSGLLAAHRGRLSFVAEIGGEEKLTLALPIAPTQATDAAIS